MDSYVIQINDLYVLLSNVFQNFYYNIRHFLKFNKHW